LLDEDVTATRFREIKTEPQVRPVFFFAQTPHPPPLAASVSCDIELSVGWSIGAKLTNDKRILSISHLPSW
jgi:hypothetical protein